MLEKVILNVRSSHSTNNVYILMKTPGTETLGEEAEDGKDVFFVSRNFHVS